MAKINSIRSKYFNEGKRIVEIARETKTDGRIWHVCTCSCLSSGE